MFVRPQLFKHSTTYFNIKYLRILSKECTYGFLMFLRISTGDMATQVMQMCCFRYMNRIFKMIKSAFADQPNLLNYRLGSSLETSEQTIKLILIQYIQLYSII